MRTSVTTLPPGRRRCGSHQAQHGPQTRLRSVSRCGVADALPVLANRTVFRIFPGLPSGPLTCADTSRTTTRIKPLTFGRHVTVSRSRHKIRVWLRHQEAFGFAMAPVARHTPTTYANACLNFLGLLCAGWRGWRCGAGLPAAIAADGCRSFSASRGRPYAAWHAIRVLGPVCHPYCRAGGKLSVFHPVIRKAKRSAGGGVVTGKPGADAEISAIEMPSAAAASLMSRSAWSAHT